MDTTTPAQAVNLDDQVALLLHSKLATNAGALQAAAGATAPGKQPSYRAVAQLLGAVGREVLGLARYAAAVAEGRGEPAAEPAAAAPAPAAAQPAGAPRPLDAAEALALAAQGLSVPKIAARLGVSNGRVRRVLRAAPQAPAPAQPGAAQAHAAARPGRRAGPFG